MMKKYQVITTFTYKNSTLDGTLEKVCPSLKKAKKQKHINRKWLSNKGHTINTEDIVVIER